MQKLETADLTAYRRGACDRCGSTERMVDVDVMIDYEGNVILCGGCIGEAALVAGYLLTEDGVRRLHEAEARAESAEVRATDAERVLSGLQTTLTRMQNLKAAK
jgi:hypothetical protein